MSAGLYDMVKMSVTGTPGTGAITLNVALAGFQTFAAAGVLDQTNVSYSAIDTGVWEVGRGTYTASGTLLSRGPLFSSSGGAAVNLTAAAIIRITLLAEDIVPGPGLGLTALGNQSQSGATVIATNQNYFTTVTPTANSAKVPASMMIPGCLPIFIKNKDPADTLYLYGDTGVQINAYGANNPMQVLSGSGVLLLVESTTQLHSVPS